MTPYYKEIANPRQVYNIVKKQKERLFDIFSVSVIMPA